MKYGSLLLAGAVLFLASCGNEETTTQTTTTTDSTTAGTDMQGTSVKMQLVADAKEYPDAQLSMNDVKATAQGDSVKLTFSFNVKNYDLKGQTGDNVSQMCNNSEKGQHIHFIMDNMPYVALYEPKHEMTVAKNSEHHLLAFLSRSYHMSLKNKEAALLYTFKVDENGKLQKMDNPTTPMVFYSRPKGDYLGKDTKNVLFDFYVWNTDLSNGEYKVMAEAEANGSKRPIDVTEWKPYFLQDLPMGTQRITLTLVDKNGAKVNGPETQVTREFTLAQDEPMNQ